MPLTHMTLDISVRFRLSVLGFLELTRWPPLFFSLTVLKVLATAASEDCSDTFWRGAGLCPKVVDSSDDRHLAPYLWETQWRGDPDSFPTFLHIAKNGGGTIQEVPFGKAGAKLGSDPLYHRKGRTRFKKCATRKGTKAQFKKK